MLYEVITRKAGQCLIPAGNKVVYGGDLSMTKTRAEAWDLVCEFVQDVGLRRHMLAVSAAMRHYAGILDADPEYWATVGLLHDFDWEIHPSYNFV